MRSGKLDRQIVIQVKSETPNEYGEPEESWSTHATVWAQARQVNAYQRFQSSAELSARVTVFRIRHLSTVTEEMRVSYDGLIWNILGIAEIERGHEMELTCQAYKGDDD